MNLYPSDKKKLLALPFYMAKRQEKPRPAKTEKDKLDLFEELTGQSYYSFDDLKFDPETKITQFDYENYLNNDLLDKVDVEDPDFKHLVKLLNFHSKTRLEAH